jgi:hypothetical protein
MSRSKKKPWGPIASGAMNWWKKLAAKRVRQAKDVSNGRYYKRLEEIWSSPSDGKWYYGDDVKYTRK